MFMSMSVCMAQDTTRRTASFFNTRMHVHRRTYYMRPFTPPSQLRDMLFIERESRLSVKQIYITNIYIKNFSILFMHIHQRTVTHVLVRLPQQAQMLARIHQSGRSYHTPLLVSTNQGAAITHLYSYPPIRTHR